ncbi:hypothetical protein [Streptomyces sp. NPDC058698]|uniref:hypothetical protein n=1 Tax=Streptomyces sp. NPDC058698 TaxID=3346606 RepID=UPI00364797B9
MKRTVRAAELDDVRPGTGYGLGLMRVDLTCGGHASGIPGCMTRDGVSRGRPPRGRR